MKLVATEIVCQRCCGRGTVPAEPHIQERCEWLISKIRDQGLRLEKGGVIKRSDLSEWYTDRPGAATLLGVEEQTVSNISNTHGLPVYHGVRRKPFYAIRDLAIYLVVGKLF